VSGYAEAVNLQSASKLPAETRRGGVRTNPIFANVFVASENGHLPDLTAEILFLLL
jgi:hypothetical protein